MLLIFEDLITGHFILIRLSLQKNIGLITQTTSRSVKTTCKQCLMFRMNEHTCSNENDLLFFECLDILIFRFIVQIHREERRRKKFGAMENKSL